MTIVRITESKKAKKELSKVPLQIIRAYEIWAGLVEVHGSKILRSFPGYHDESLRGEWKGFRSSRLSKQYRFIYASNKSNEIEIVSVERVTAHDYRRKK